VLNAASTSGRAGTWEVAASLVVQVIVAIVPMIFDAATEEIVGAVVSRMIVPVTTATSYRPDL
jgi:hypothetical protein